jgi:hypothetical protein
MSSGNRGLGGDGKLNGFHNPKHKRGEIDRECLFIFITRMSFADL